MNTLTTTATVLLASSSAAIAQPDVVIPDRADALYPGRSLDIGSRSERRMQFLIDNSSIPTGQALWRELQVRADHDSNLLPIVAFATLTLSNSPRTWSHPSTTFDQNHGASKVTVYQGAIQLPANSTTPPSWPTAWTTLANFRSGFSFAPTPGGSLCVELVVDGLGAGSPPYWAAEYHDDRPWNGLLDSSHTGSISSCMIARHPPTPGGPVIGQTWGSLRFLAPQVGNQPAMAACAFGFQGSGGSLGGLTLPLPLTLLGFGGCSLIGTDMTLITPMPYTRAGIVTFVGFAELPAIPMSGSSAVVGLEFFTQALFAHPDAATGQPSATTSDTRKWTVHDGSPIHASSVRSVAPDAPTGTVYSGTLALRLR